MVLSQGQEARIAPSLSKLSMLLPVLKLEVRGDGCRPLEGNFRGMTYAVVFSDFIHACPIGVVPETTP
jgi:hypothetical protein